MFKLIHFGDTHVKNLKYYNEYITIFDQIFSILKQEKPDLIVHCGDLGHSKTQISPEYVSLASYFLKNLADIAPTRIILGNHDLGLKNLSRLDSISPLVDNLNHPNLQLYKKSGEYSFNNEISLNVLSIFDKNGWNLNPTNSDKINIVLYHGSIGGCETDLGWKMTNADNDLSIFKNFDYAFLGDIHKSNQILDLAGKVRYCGSTIQQNFGETNDKGFLIWKIYDKNRFECQHVSIPNPKPFVSVYLNSYCEIPKKTIVPQDAKLRLIGKQNFSYEQIREALDLAKTTFKPEYISYIDKSETKSIVDKTSEETKKLNLRKISTQEKLIKEFLKEYSPSDELLQRIFEINKNYNLIAESKELIGRNINFNIERFEWDNLFGYGPKNSVSFSNLNGIVGIFGENYSGKSSVIDGLLWVIFSSISKKNKKTLNVINTNCLEASGKVWLSDGTKMYRISRRAEKYTKKLYGVETIEAKSYVDFAIVDSISDNILENLNGEDVPETNKNIAKIFGSIEDFLLTSMSSQLGSLQYIEEGSTERKKILGKFLDLEFFADKFKMANDDISKIKSFLRNYENVHFDETIKEFKEHIEKNNKTKQILEIEINQQKQKIKELSIEIAILDQKLQNSPKNIIDIENLIKTLNDLSERKKKKEENLKKIEFSFNLIQKSNEEVLDEISKIDVVNLKFQEKNMQDLQMKLHHIERDIAETKNIIKIQEKKLQILEEVPCGPEYSHCKFIRDAYEAKTAMSGSIIALDETINQKENIEQQFSKFEIINKSIHIYSELISKNISLERELNDIQRNINKEKEIAISFDVEINKIQNQIDEYNENEIVQKECKKIKIQKIQKDASIEHMHRVLTSNEEKFIKCIQNLGSFEAKLENTMREQKLYLNQSKQYEAYELFLKCMHPNGISYEIIKKKLPVLNDEISKHLSTSDFQIFFQNEDNRLEIYIKKNNSTLPIEMASVAQKMIAAMAIRRAFTNISSLPKSDIFILDEPATSLDEKNLDNFIQTLDILKTCFKCVILISHLDALKDTTDTIINIEKKNNCSHVFY